MLNTPSLMDPTGYPTDEAPLDAYSRAVAAVADRIGPAVVRVAGSDQGRRQRGVGSGVVIASDGLVLTNSHVVGGTKRVRLAFAEDGEAEAQVLGDGPDTDLALLRTELPPRHAGSGAWRLKNPAAGSACGRDRQSARIRIHHNSRCCVGARPIFALGQRATDRQHHSNRRGAQPREFGRPTRGDQWRGRWHQYRDDHWSAGPLFCGGEQYGLVCRQRIRPPRARAS
jgi:Trypsin-like peptidase domain